MEKRVTSRWIRRCCSPFRVVLLHVRSTRTTMRLDTQFYLRIANELYLKRLIVGGFEGVFEFSRNFRNEGMDRTHNPEFTVMELYVAYKDYHWMMDFIEGRCSSNVATAANGSPSATFQGKHHRLRTALQAHHHVRRHQGEDRRGRAGDGRGTLCVHCALKNNIEVTAAWAKAS